MKEALEIYGDSAKAIERNPDNPGMGSLIMRDSENMAKNPRAPSGIDPIEPPNSPFKAPWIQATLEYDQVSWAMYRKAFFQILTEAYFFGGEAARELARVTHAVARRDISWRIPEGKFNIHHTALFTILEQNRPASLTPSDLANVFDYACPCPTCAAKEKRGQYHSEKSLRRQREQFAKAERETIKAAREIAHQGRRGVYAQAKRSWSKRRRCGKPCERVTVLSPCTRPEDRGFGSGETTPTLGGNDS